MTDSACVTEAPVTVRQEAGSFNSQGPKPHLRHIKRRMMKLGTCAQTIYNILNCECGHPKVNEERAVDPLAGGILSEGYQCGMLWGASLAVGAEAYRRHGGSGKAVGVAVAATQHLLRSFTTRTGTPDCRAITRSDLRSVFGVAKYLVTGRAMACFRLVERWAPEAVQAAHEGLTHEAGGASRTPVSCATEVARRMGASDEEAVTVAGLAGGLGLSGNACGALGAAMWMRSLAWCREHPGKSGYANRNNKEMVKAFRAATGSEFLCSRITGRCFQDADDHSEFVGCGGCERLLTILAHS